MTTSCFWSPRSRNTANAAGPSTPPKIKVLELNGWRRGKILIEKDISFWIFRWDHRAGQALGVNTPKIIVIFSRNFTGIFLET